MKLKVNINLLERLVLLYPIILGVIFLFNINPFFITAPYFFLILVLIVIRLALKKRITFQKGKVTNVILTGILLIISLINFSSVRFSLPVMFAFFLFIFQLYIYSAYSQYGKSSQKQARIFFVIYVVLSLFFLFFISFSQMEVGDRFRGFTGSPTTYSAIIVVIYVLLDTKQSYTFSQRVLLYMLVFVLVYLTKTRLVTLFLIAYPLIVFAVKKLKMSYSLVYLFFFSSLFFVYPVYELVAEYFPNIASSRYEGGKDTSFGLRNYLYKFVERDFYEGSWTQILFGKGNESSRIIVEQLFNADLFPHNDYIRIINDWGLVGGGVFFIFLYRISKVNLTTLMISIMYLLLFYSNMVFNLFLMSLLMLSSAKSYQIKTDKTDDAT